MSDGLQFKISSYTTKMEPYLALSVENSYLIRIYCEQSMEGIQDKKKSGTLFTR